MTLWLVSLALLPLLLWQPLKWLAPLGWLLLLWEVGLASFWLLVLLSGTGPDLPLPSSIFLLALLALPLGSAALGLPRQLRFGVREALWQSFGVAVLGFHLLIWPYLLQSSHTALNFRVLGLELLLVVGFFSLRQQCPHSCPQHRRLDQMAA